MKIFLRVQLYPFSPSLPALDWLIPFLLVSPHSIYTLPGSGVKLLSKRFSELDSINLFNLKCSIKYESKTERHMSI